LVRSFVRVVAFFGEALAQLREECAAILAAEQ
jgi:hypothetical protein